MSSHIRDIIAMNTLGDLFLWLGKLLIASFTALFTYIMCRAFYTDYEMFIVCTIAGFAIGYAVGFYVMEILELTVDAIFMCYCYEQSSLMPAREHGDQPFTPEHLARLLGSKIE